MKDRSWVRVEWGPNVLDFDTAEDAVAFARESGATAISYRHMWQTLPR